MQGAEVPCKQDCTSAGTGSVLPAAVHQQGHNGSDPSAGTLHCEGLQCRLCRGSQAVHHPQLTSGTTKVRPWLLQAAELFGLVLLWRHLLGSSPASQLGRNWRRLHLRTAPLIALDGSPVVRDPIILLQAQALLQSFHTLLAIPATMFRAILDAHP